MVVVLIIESSMIVGIIEYYVLEKRVSDQLVSLSKATKTPEEFVQILKQEVIPQKGFTLGVRWDDVGKQLVDSGVIDQAQYEKLFEGDQIAEQMKYLSFHSPDHMVINEKNSRFMVNTLWTLGLVNKSKILDEGSMKTYGEGDVMGFASTGGWNFGSKPTRELYSSQDIVSLTPEQERLVENIAQNVFRPCCGNPTSFPDCNHGMAALGYIELAVSQGLSEKQIYTDLLSLNSFWFSQNYVELAAYMNQEGKAWQDVDPKKMLAAEFSSAQGAAFVKRSIQSIPGFGNSGGGCSA